MTAWPYIAQQFLTPLCMTTTQKPIPISCFVSQHWFLFWVQVPRNRTIACSLAWSGPRFTNFSPQFEFDENFALLYFQCCPSDRNKFLNMPRQHRYRAMYKILKRSLCQNRGENETKFPSNLNLDGKTVTETGPWVDPFYLHIIMRRTQSETFGPDASLTEGISIQVLIRLEYLFVYIISSVKSFVTKFCRPKDSITVSGSTGSSIWLNHLPFIAKANLIIFIIPNNYSCDVRRSPTTDQPFGTVHFGGALNQPIIVKHN